MKKGEIKMKSILKRILSLFIINVMILSLFAPYSKVFASNNIDVVLSSNATSITAGQEIEVKISISGSESLSALEGTLEINSSTFQVLNVQTPFTTWTTDVDATNYISIYRVSGTRYANNEEIGTIKLRVLNTVSSANIKLTGIYMVNEDNDEIEDEPDVELTIPTNTSNPPTPPAPTTHTVTYDYATNGGTSATATTATVAEGSQIDLTPTATKSGFDFVGWNTNANAETALQSSDSDATMGTRDVTLYAIYRKEVRPVFKYMDDGDLITYTPQIVGYIYNNNTTATITTPTIDIGSTSNTWNIDGWTTNTSSNPPSTDIVTPGSQVNISSNNTYYMVYKKNTKISFDLNGGSGATISDIPGSLARVNSYNRTSVYSGSVLVNMPSANLTKPGYTFMNKWNTEASGRGTDYNCNQSYNMQFQDDMILYAVWGPKSYKVRYNGNGSNSGSMQDSASYVFGSLGGITLDSNQFSRTGYTFKGWATSSTGAKVYNDGVVISNSAIPGLADNNDIINLYAVWEENTYNITYVTDPTGKQLPSNNPTTYKATDGNVTLTNPSVPGYIFDGWIDNQGITTPQTTYTINGLGSNITITAKLTAKQYTINYDGRGAISGSTGPTNYTYEQGGATGKQLDANQFVRSGYNFLGWSTNPSATSATYSDQATMSNSDIIANADTSNQIQLYAVWQEETFNITYATDPTGKESSLPTSNPTTYKATDGNVTLTNPNNIDGYTFEGWVDSNNPTASAQTTYTITGLNGPITITAKLRAITYTINYDGNGATSGSTGPTNYTYEQGGATGKQLDANQFVRSGYNFLGWSTNPSATSATYSDQATMSNSDIIANADTNNQIQLYAVWEEALTNYNVEHYKQDSTGNYVLADTETPQPQGRVGDTVTAQPRTDYPGYTFDNTIPGTVESGTIPDPATGILTLKLYYKYSELTVEFNANGTNATVSPTSKTVIFNSAYDALPTPTRPGYTFAGWYEDATNTNNLVEATTTVTRPYNHTLYAHWIVNEYTVNYIGRIADGSPEGVTGVLKTKQVPYGELPNYGMRPDDFDALKATVVTPKYTYVVNTTTPFIGDLTTAITSDRTIEVNYNSIINQYKVTFCRDDGTYIDDVMVDYGGTASDAAIDHTKAPDSMYTYIFSRWVDSSENTDNLSNVIQDRTVYARFTPISQNYEVKFVDDDGSQISIKSDYHYNDDLQVPADPSKAATAQYTYTFLGWYDASDASQTIVNLTNAVVTENKTYKAKYSEVTNQYKIAFYNNDNTFIVYSDSVNYGDSATYPNSTNDLSYELNGYRYTFDKWVTQVNGTTEDDLSNVIQDRDVYASYTSELIEYTITYEDTNGALNTNPTTYTVNSGIITLDPLGPKEGMTFAGWYTDRNYTDEVTSIDSSRMENITLYAKWDIDKLMYFVKLDASVLDTDPSVITYRNESSANVVRLTDGTAILIYDDFDDAKAYVDNLFNEGNGPAIGIFDLNNDLVYWPEVHPKYYVKANESDPGDEYTDFDIAKAFVDGEFANGTTLKIYDEKGKLVYEPKAETPKVQYFVKQNWNDPNTPTNTFDKFSLSKIEADRIFANGTSIRVYDINGEIVYEPTDEELYLKSSKYQIGSTRETPVDEYVSGDKYLYKIPPKTTLAHFLYNCDTNGTITVYKLDGSKLSESEYVGTGMILKDTRGDQRITVTLGVIGDTDGDGQVTAADLADTIQMTLDAITLNEIQFLSLDMNSNGHIEADDLADEIQYTLI